MKVSSIKGKYFVSHKLTLALRRHQKLGAWLQLVVINGEKPAKISAEPARNTTKPARNTTEPARNTTEPARNTPKVARNTTELVETLPV